MKEILGGNTFEGTLQQAFTDLSIEAKRTYKRSNIKTKFDAVYEVWELSDEDFERLCNIPDKNWEDKWGWWRSSEGTNIEGSPRTRIKVNGYPVIAWINTNALDSFTDEPLSDEMLDDIVYGKSNSDDNVLQFPMDDIEFDDLLGYYSQKWGASTEKNVCAISAGLAKLNRITMGELFNKYVG